MNSALVLGVAGVAGVLALAASSSNKRAGSEAVVEQTAQKRQKREEVQEEATPMVVQSSPPAPAPAPAPRYDPPQPKKDPPQPKKDPPQPKKDPPQPKKDKKRKEWQVHERKPKIREEIDHDFVHPYDLFASDEETPPAPVEEETLPAPVEEDKSLLRNDDSDGEDMYRDIVRGKYNSLVLYGPRRPERRNSFTGEMEAVRGGWKAYSQPSSPTGRDTHPSFESMHVGRSITNDIVSGFLDAIPNEPETVPVFEVTEEQVPVATEEEVVVEAVQDEVLGNFRSGIAVVTQTLAPAYDIADSYKRHMRYPTKQFENPPYIEASILSSALLARNKPAMDFVARMDSGVLYVDLQLAKHPLIVNLTMVRRDGAYEMIGQYARSEYNEAVNELREEKRPKYQNKTIEEVTDFADMLTVCSPAYMHAFDTKEETLNIFIYEAVLSDDDIYTVMVGDVEYTLPDNTKLVKKRYTQGDTNILRDRLAKGTGGLASIMTGEITRAKLETNYNDAEFNEFMVDKMERIKSSLAVFVQTTPPDESDTEAYRQYLEKMQPYLTALANYGDKLQELDSALNTARNKWNKQRKNKSYSEKLILWRVLQSNTYKGKLGELSEAVATWFNELRHLSSPTVQSKIEDARLESVLLLSQTRPYLVPPNKT